MAAEPFVGLAAETALQRLYRREAAKLGIALQERVNVGGFDGVRRMVEAGLGLAILPSAGAAPCLGGTKVAVRPLAEAWALRPLALCVRDDDALSAAARRLIAHLLHEPA